MQLCIGTHIFCDRQTSAWSGTHRAIPCQQVFCRAPWHGIQILIYTHISIYYHPNTNSIHIQIRRNILSYPNLFLANTVTKLASNTSASKYIFGKKIYMHPNIQICQYILFFKYIFDLFLPLTVGRVKYQCIIAGEDATVTPHYFFFNLT